MSLLAVDGADCVTCCVDSGVADCLTVAPVDSGLIVTATGGDNTVGLWIAWSDLINFFSSSLRAHCWASISLIFLIPELK